MKIIGIIGAGSMGSGIAEVAATNGHEVRLFDNAIGALDKFEKGIEKSLSNQVQKGKITEERKQEIHAKLHFVKDMNALADCDLIIEAIVEDIQIKKQVFKTLDNITIPSCILASNTSSLSIASIASACEHPERVLGIHFFNPATLMPLVEIIPGIATDNQLLTDARNIINSWNKVTVLAKDTPGFIVNRIARPYYGEAIRIFEEGIADMRQIDMVMKTLGGFRMGPFELMDFIGNDINYTVTETIFREFWFDARYKPSFTQKRLVESGRLGRKTGRGYYDYTTENQVNDISVNAELSSEILNRILAMLMNEAADALYLKIATKEDIDLAMTKGVNYPKGLLQWADEKGIEFIFSTLMNLYEEYNEDRYRPSPIWKKMIKNGSKFYE
jgi:3-hydroxybutyryl-CoA dehydrogenase